MTKRCAWAKAPLDVKYHDTEWGVPLYEDNKLFEFLILEGVQAGLSWSIVLQRRDAYREAYEGFIPETVAQFDEKKITSLLGNKKLIRNKLKIHASVKNAQAFLRLQKEFATFSHYLWCFVDNKSITNNWQTPEQVPNETPLSQRLSKDLKKRGFTFVGPTICYALMQASGLINDHLTTCFRHQEIINLR
ncbi:MAG: DNA-3-methyladenine glycosylase [Cycloclasticus sp. symbiont of Poecilosclerida sp. M]|nr:MAG: DNA-3-methyladenine glycosylase [Cycloclasticus sp. symbiont of Poecilosclerida sp. M]